MKKSKSENGIFSGVKQYKKQPNWRARSGSYGFVSKVRLVDLEDEYNEILKAKVDPSKSKRYSFVLKESNLLKEGNEDSFENEVAVLKECHGHKHIVGFEEDFLNGAVGCIVLELCKPIDLHGVLLDHSIKLDDLTKLDYCIQIANGMSYLHSNNIVHRDLKTNNILFSRDDDTVRICDFGSSKKIENTKNSRHGTPNFIAPEVFNETLDDMSDPRKLDIFSFGTIMWMMWARSEPFKGYRGTPGKTKLINAISYRSKRPNISKIQGKAPKGVVELIEECWRSYPSARPESFLKIEFRLKRIRFKLKKNTKQPVVVVVDEEQAFIDEQYEEYQAEKKWEEENKKNKKDVLIDEEEIRRIEKRLQKKNNLKGKTLCFPSFFSF
jgi:serine/threonine protein kinase